MVANRLGRSGAGRLLAQATAVLLCLFPFGRSDAADVTFSFSTAPDSFNALTGSFVYNTPGGPSATFTGFEYANGPAFTDGDHTGDDAGLVYGSGAGPATISFSSPVQLVEMYVQNFYGDFDDRSSNPTAYKLFSIAGNSGGSGAFSYDRATQSGAGGGVATGYLRIAPGAPMTIDSLSFANFDQDVLDDLKVQVVTVPEPAVGVLLVVGGLVARLLARPRRCASSLAGHAPPWNATCRRTGCSNSTYAGGWICLRNLV